MSKELVFIREIISKYHPKFTHSIDLKRTGIESPEIFHVERLIEETLACVGNMQFVDAEGYDFLPDFSDSKTVSVNAKSRYAEITGVENKIGALRITVYNTFTNCADFFFVPKNDLDQIKLACYGKNSFKERVRFRYNEKGHYNYFEDFRVDTFEQLATIR